MDAIMEYLSSHPAMLTMLVIFAVIIILYFIFKKFIKLVLVLLLIVLAAAGYYYFQNPNKMSEKVKESIDTVKSGTDKVVEKSKSFYKDSKDLIDKTKEMPGDVNRLFKGEEKKAGK
jgi:glucan phosphoethanolaminetransferase (alkaline phosphatase superfamily)